MWIQRDGEPVQALKFESGITIPRGVVQEMDQGGAYYVATTRDGRRFRLTMGDFICYDDDKKIIDVQSNGKFMDQHMFDASIPEKEPEAEKEPYILTTTENEMGDFEALPETDDLEGDEV